MSERDEKYAIITQIRPVDHARPDWGSFVTFEVYIKPHRLTLDVIGLSGEGYDAQVAAAWALLESILEEMKQAVIASGPASNRQDK
jgi:hypothetical protein